MSEEAPAEPAPEAEAEAAPEAEAEAEAAPEGEAEAEAAPEDAAPEPILKDSEEWTSSAGFGHFGMDHHSTRLQGLQDTVGALEWRAQHHHQAPEHERGTEPGNRKRHHPPAMGRLVSG